MHIKELLLHKYLAWHTRPVLLKRHWRRKKISLQAKTDAVHRRKVPVGAAQLEAVLFHDVRDYFDEMHRHTSRADKAGVRLLVFPENNSFQLLGLIPGIEKIAAAGNTDAGAGGISVADLFRFAEPFFNRTAYYTFATLAKAYDMVIMVGSMPHLRGKDVVNRAVLFGPDGQLLGTQDKVHLLPLEHSWGLSPGNEFSVFDSPLGKLAMPVCMDATYFETFRILVGLGAEIVMVPIANAEPYNEWLALRGIWPRVQESLVFGIKSALVGSLLGYTLTGKAGIFAPLPLTPNGDGVLAEAPDPDKEGFVRADLDLEALSDLRANHPYLGDKNPSLTNKYFPHIYE